VRVNEVGRTETEDEAPMSGGMRSLQDRRLCRPLLKGEKWRTPAAHALITFLILPLRKLHSLWYNKQVEDK
jgi:hypothetical protein